MAKIVIYSPNLIGKSMAGAAIRPWEFARVLAQEHEVILLSPGESTVESKEFLILSMRDRASWEHVKNADCLIAQRLTFPLALMAKFHRLKIIIDAYVPGPLELLEHFKYESLDEGESKVFSEISNLVLSFQMADGILCASEKQRELWLGFLLGQKMITPALYHQDPGLRRFLAVVPFGLSSTPPKKTGQGLREKFGLTADDKVILWGGGIWNWFDPLSLIKAMKIIHQTRDDVKLIFMGVKPPDPTLPNTLMSAQALDLAKELNILNRAVFFNTNWIPYEERESVLVDADIGVSTHFDHLETSFAFRTRMLDYLWAGLPMVATQGDWFSQIIETHQLGAVVPYEDEKAIAIAILNLIDDPEEMNRMKDNIGRLRPAFYWESVTVPLKKMIDELMKEPPSFNHGNHVKTLCRFLIAKIRERGITACLKPYLPAKIRGEKLS